MTFPKWSFLLAVFIVAWQECHYTDIYVWNQCQAKTKEFETRDQLADFLRANCAPNNGISCDAYEAKKLNFEVSIHTEERKKEMTEIFEIGREVKFK